VLTKAVVLAEGERITASDIELRAAPSSSGSEKSSRRAFEKAEAEQIAKALAENRWNVAKVSRLLGIPRPTLYRRIKRYGLNES
jgi:transcriptional regulator of acetoin/glycerol metabolism